MPFSTRKFRALRKQSGLTISELARRAGLAHTTVHRLNLKEHLRGCRVDTVERLAHVLKCDPVDLMSGWGVRDDR